MYTIKNTETLLLASKETGLEVTAEKTKYIVMPRDQYAGQNYNEENDNHSCERVEEFKYLGTNLTIKIPSRKKLRTDSSKGMLAIIRCRIFCVPV